MSDESKAAGPNLPVTQESGELVLDMVHDLHADHIDPQAQHVQQNLGVAILPLALIAFMILVLVAAAWTLSAAGG